MAINVEFYHNSSDNEVLNKTLVAGPVIPVTLKSDTPVEKPEFMLSSANYNDYYNYAYIPSLGKYYYVAAPTKAMGDTVLLQLTEDVIMTLKEKIKTLTCTVAKNENVADAYLFDDAYKVKAYRDIVTQPFPNSLDQNSIVLMTLG